THSTNVIRPVSVYRPPSRATIRNVNECDPDVKLRGAARTRKPELTRLGLAEAAATSGRGIPYSAAWTSPSMIASTPIAVRELNASIAQPEITISNDSPVPVTLTRSTFAIAGSAAFSRPSVKLTLWNDAIVLASVASDSHPSDSKGQADRPSDSMAYGRTVLT